MRLSSGNLFIFYSENISSVSVVPCVFVSLCLHVFVCVLRNGQSLGTAFTNIKTGPGVAYFPAISLSFKESVAFNFGSRPLRYPSPLRDRKQMFLYNMWKYLKKDVLNMIMYKGGYCYIVTLYLFTC